jgi:hypothetical protein
LVLVASGSLSLKLALQNCSLVGNSRYTSWPGLAPRAHTASDIENLLCASVPQSFTQFISYEAEKRAERAGGLDALKREQELNWEKDRGSELQSALCVAGYTLLLPTPIFECSCGHPDKQHAESDRSQIKRSGRSNSLHAQHV